MKTEVTAADVRAWARKQGIPVGQRGHLPVELIARYNRKHRTKVFVNKNPFLKAAV